MVCIDNSFKKPQNDSVMLNGTVYNGMNEAVSPFNFTWTSDKDGIIGTGNNITYFNLSAGDHIITLKVLDSNSSTGNDTVPITITQKGDLNHDGNITSADVRIALRNNRPLTHRRRSINTDAKHP